MAEAAVNLQTAILKSDRDRLKNLQEICVFDTIGEVIGWLLDQVERDEPEGDES